MRQSICVFSYGLDLDLGLLHSVVGGPRPRCKGPAWLPGYVCRFGVSGHLPGLVSKPGHQTLGALTLLTADQLRRMDAWLVAYSRQRLPVEPFHGRYLHAWAFLPSVPPQRPGVPSLDTLTALCRGAAVRGLGDDRVNHLLSWRPADSQRILISIDQALA